METPRTVEPRQTCPLIDSLIKELDRDLRQANADLRDRGDEWATIAESYYDAACEWEEYATTLEKRIAQLEDELSNVN